MVRGERRGGRVTQQVLSGARRLIWTAHRVVRFALCLGIGFGGCVSSRPDAPYGQSLDPLAASAIVLDASRAESALKGADSTAASNQAALRRLEAVKAREGELHAWVEPLLRSYLPPETPLAARIYLATDLKKAISVDGDAVVVDVAAISWGESDEALWNAIVRAVYRAALTRAVGPRGEGESVASLMLSKVMIEGLVDFVAAQGRPQGSGRPAYRVADDRDQVADRFAKLDEAARSLASGTHSKEVLQGLDSDDAKKSVFGVAGASMAAAIEREQGREALVGTIRDGPVAFYEAYQQTEPGALVNFQLPEKVAAPQGAPSAAH